MESALKDIGHADIQFNLIISYSESRT